MRVLREDRLGRYELLIELGRGGMAELFLGRLRGAGGFAKLVALKRILPHLAQDPQFKELFLNEGRIAAQLSHPNVCHVFELEEADGELFLAMEYLDGVSWDHLSSAMPRGPHALWLTAGVLGQAAEGLHYAHTLRDIEGRLTSVVHRDVSPQNLFVTVDGVCKVLDFGVSKILNDGPRTRTGVIKGKLPYMAPEQIRGEPLDARADVFSLGVCAWEALAGARLFDRSTDFAIWKAVTEEPLPSLSQHWPECPRHVESVIHRALERERDKRHATAREFAETLRAAAGGSAGLPDIANAVRTSCGDRIAARQREVATAVSSRRDGGLAAPGTDHDDKAGSTINLRQYSARVERPEDARPEDARPTMNLKSAVDDAGETRDLRRDAASTLEPQISAARVIRETGDPPPRRGHLRTTLSVAVLAAGAAAGAVALVMNGRSSAAPVASQPAAPAIPTAAPTPDSEVPAAEEAASDEALADPLVARETVAAPAAKKPGKKPTAPGGAASTASDPAGAGDEDIDLSGVHVDGVDVGKRVRDIKKAAAELEKLRDGSGDASGD